MNAIERHKLIVKAIEAKRTGNKRLAKLIAHQVSCLSEEEIPPNMKIVLKKLGASLK